jgi:hypothetical protein
VTVFLGGGFAAKYLHGGGNFSVPLQWMLGLRRLKMDAFWLEHLPSEGNTRDDERKIDNFRRQLRARTRRPVLFALSQNTGRRARSRRDSPVSECRNTNCSIDSPSTNIQGTTLTRPHHPFSKKEAAKKKPHNM